VLLHLKRLSPSDTRLAEKWLLGQQRGDGSFAVQPYAHEGDLGTTACGWAALHLCGSSDAATKARDWVKARGGVPAVIEKMSEGDFGALFLAMAGLADAKQLPCPNTTAMSLPGVLDFMSSRFHAGILMGALQADITIQALRGEWSGFIDSIKGSTALSVFREFQNDDGSVNGASSITAMALPMFKAIDTAESRTMFTRALAWLERQAIRDETGLHFPGYGTDVWSTAFVTRAMLAGGVSATDSDISRALTWMADAQLLSRPQPTFNNRKPNAVRVGGWGFQKTNQSMPDNDDAGVTLSAIGMALDDPKLDPVLRQKLSRSVELAKRWLFDMQNEDGGWGAFVWELGTKPPGPIMEKQVKVDLANQLAMIPLVISPPPFVQDPATEDVTSRVLHGLAQVGEKFNSSPQVQRAVAFLKKQQTPLGPWWGRWVVNYLSATSFVLIGLKAVGVDMKQDWVQRAANWVRSKQNEDGGWGEGPSSYKSIDNAGKGPTMLPLTGLVVQGLVAAGAGNSPEVEKAIALLVHSQRPDGTWSNGEYLHTNIPPDTFYVYPEAARFYPAEALGRYLTFKEHTPPPTQRWSNEKLDRYRQVMDPVADDVIAKIFARGDRKAVNKLMGDIFRTDQPIPPEMPDEAEAYFKNVTLPEWADPKQIQIAEQLFTRTGWQLAMGLFCSSLPQAYACARGAHVIAQTQGLTKHVKQRIFETAQFLFDVMDEGALKPSGRGVRTVQKVRLMHATVRYMLLNHDNPKWDAEKLGLPINQEDLAGTLMTFSIVTLDGLRTLGVPFSMEESNAWLHTWKVVGSLLGVDEQLLPRDLLDGQELMEAIRDRQWCESQDGKDLIKPLVELMESYFPGTPLDGLPVALIRALAGDVCGDLLGLPPSDWTRHLIHAGTELDEWLPHSNNQDLGNRFIAWATHAFMEGVVFAEREGKEAKFRIPKSLTKTVTDKN
jgi:squalene cyclase